MAALRTPGQKSPKGREGFTPPYPPSWFDRLADWVDRLPGPAWAFYIVLGLAVGLAGMAIEWAEGAYPVGSLNLLHIWTLANFAYLIGLMHYLDKSAAAAIAAFRPLLHSEGAGVKETGKDGSFASLAYQLTTLPARPTLLFTLAGAAASIALAFTPPAAENIRIYFPRSAETPIALAFVMANFSLQIALLGPLAYHTIHQLVRISRVYTEHARINIYQLQPLYVLSVPGAWTSIGFILYMYIWFSIRAWASQAWGPIEIVLTSIFGAIAGATSVLPLLGAHRRLVDEKNRRLSEASRRFEAVTHDLHRALDAGRLRQIDPLNRALASLEIEQNTLRRIPTWPWQPGAVRGLLAALLLPVVVWLIQVVLGRVFGA